MYFCVQNELTAKGGIRFFNVYLVYRVCKEMRFPSPPPQASIVLFELDFPRLVSFCFLPVTKLWAVNVFDAVLQNEHSAREA